MENNINKDNLIDYIVSKVEISKKDAAMALDALTDKITEELRKGNKITLTGFGTFKVSKRAAREGVNPKTGERIQIAAMTVPKFKAGKSLKEAIK